MPAATKSRRSPKPQLTPQQLTRELCDFLAKIPMPGTMESLNVSVATGVALFEALRQRTSKR